MTQQMPDEPLYRDSPFSYQCNACKRCCVNKRIQVNPYELLRLARNKGMSTREFALAHMGHEGPYLNRKDDGSCVFLTDQGCGVHLDRPLACRVYPLGRFVSGTGEESFGHHQPHPQTEGVYGEDGTVENFLTQQGVWPYFAAADRYQELFNRLFDALQKILPDTENLADDAQQGMFEHNEDDLPVFMEWLDADSAVMKYCQEQQIECPESIDARTQMHIESIEYWLITQTGEPE